MSRRPWLIVVTLNVCEISVTGPGDAGEGSKYRVFPLKMCSPSTRVVSQYSLDVVGSFTK